MMSEFYSLACKTLKGADFPFSSLQGKVVIVVNVASHCGFTKHYAGLQTLYNKYKDQGLEIIGFPCNQFGEQEPGGQEEIYDFCTKTYSVTFPMMEKIEVNGDNVHPVYQFLKSQKSFLGLSRVKWNFEKFLVDREGKLYDRYVSLKTPEDMEGDVQKLLAQKSKI